MAKPTTPSPIQATLLMRYIPIRGRNCLIGGYVGKPKRNGRSGPRSRIDPPPRLSDGRLGKRELLAGAPLIGDVIDDERGAHALDRALLEAVIGVVRRNEDHGAVGGEGRTADMALLAVVDVGAEIVGARFPGQVGRD